MAVVAGAIALFMVAPADRSYSGLWRTGGAALAIGGIFTFWDLYYLLTWQHGLAIAVLFILTAWIIGAGASTSK